ncbi:hypothetical protein F4778DRAFT_780486 [Xylariomycetidae sp. FL2044]|nr:hypothetical protein F4778DRAFT_780486 [Xylariomycetidae sp. FL2044]
MFRRLCAGSRAPAARFLSSTLPRQAHSRAVISREAVTPAKRPRPLLPSRRIRDQQEQRRKLLGARIYGTVWISIGMLVMDESLDWRTRIGIGIQVVQNITLEQDHPTRLKQFWDTGHWLLHQYGGTDVEHHGALRLPADSGFSSPDELETRLLTVPDPDIPGGTVILCLAAFLGPDEEDTEIYVSEHGNRLTDAAEAMLPAFEKFAAETYPSSPTRGAILVLQQNSDWKSVYWDGHRWINLVYLEWQTAESMGLATEAEIEEGG